MKAWEDFKKYSNHCSHLFLHRSVCVFLSVYFCLLQSKSNNFLHRLACNLSLPPHPHIATRTQTMHFFLLTFHYWGVQATAFYTFLTVLVQEISDSLTGGWPLPLQPTIVFLFKDKFSIYLSLSLTHILFQSKFQTKSTYLFYVINTE